MSKYLEKRSPNIKISMTSPIETAYSDGPIEDIPDVGPERLEPEQSGFEQVQSERPDGSFHKRKTTRKSRTFVKKQTPDGYNKIEERSIQPETCEIVSGSFWAYLIIASVAAIILILYANDAYCLRAVPYAPNRTAFFLGLTLSIFSIVWAGYRGHISVSNLRSRYILSITFVVNLALIVLWGILLFGSNNIRFAFLTNVLAIFAAIWWIWLMWNVDRPASILLLSYLAWLIHLLYSIKDS